MYNNCKNDNRTKCKSGAVAFETMITFPIMLILFLIVFNLVMKINTNAELKQFGTSSIRTIATEPSLFDAYDYYYTNIEGATENGKKKYVYSCFKIKSASALPTTPNDIIYKDNGVVNSSDEYYRSLSPSEKKEYDKKNVSLFNSALEENNLATFRSYSRDVYRKKFQEKYSDSLWDKEYVIEITICQEFTRFENNLVAGVTINGTYYPFYETYCVAVFTYNIENVSRTSGGN